MAAIIHDGLDGELEVKKIGIVSLEKLFRLLQQIAKTVGGP